jgi:hypothetical protein
MFLNGVSRRGARLNPTQGTMTETRFSTATRSENLDNSVANCSNPSGRVLASFFSHKTQNIVHFSLEF